MDVKRIQFLTTLSLVIFVASSCKHHDAEDLAQNLEANRNNSMVLNEGVEAYAPAEEIYSFETDPDALLLIGEWEAVSNNHISICGNMTIDTALISFEKKEDVTFQIWNKVEDEYEWVLKISKDVDAGLYMRIGPVVGAKSRYSQMEVAYYTTKEEAMAKRNFPSENASSWGIYTRK